MSKKTNYEKCPAIDGQSKSEQEAVEWKQVTLGGVSGILMGAGMMYAGQAFAQKPEKDEMPEDVTIPENGETNHVMRSGMQVAVANDHLSFSEAFTRARAEIGPGGVFQWNGGIYNTYTVEEWNAITPEQRHSFAQQVRPEVHPNNLSTPTDANPHIVVEQHVYHHEAAKPDDVQALEQQIAQNFDMGEDVRIVGYANADGHLVVGYDTVGDNRADIAIIDIDDNLKPSDADIIFDGEGHVSTLGELGNRTNHDETAQLENPDVAPDMPDYMNDANIDNITDIA